MPNKLANSSFLQWDFFSEWRRYQILIIKVNMTPKFRRYNFYATIIMLFSVLPYGLFGVIFGKCGYF